MSAGPRGIVSPVRLERTLPAFLGRCLLPLGYEDMEPPPGADPGLPPYEGGAAAVRGGEAGHPGLEPGNSGFRARRVCRIPLMAIECGRRESNAQATRFELVRYASSRHSRMVRREGIEPPTVGLRIHSSTAELAARERMRRIELPSAAWKAAALAIRRHPHRGSRR
jgi:hypothetical protein